METERVILMLQGLVPARGLALTAELPYTVDQIPLQFGSDPIFNEAVAAYRIRTTVVLDGEEFVASEGTITVNEGVLSETDFSTFVDRLTIQFTQDSGDTGFSFVANFEAPDETLPDSALPPAAAADAFSFVSGFFFEDDGQTEIQSTLEGGVLAAETETVALSDGLTVAQAQLVALLYEAALDRDGLIDLPGLNFWIDQREAGLTERGLSQFFLDSGEFEQNFGAPESLSDREIVEVLFRNVLDREPDAGGVDFWVNALTDPNFDRADLLLAFAIVDENVQGLPIIGTLGELPELELDWQFIGA